MIPTPKFKQIMTAGHNQWVIYGLSEEGDVYRWTEGNTVRYWKKLENLDLINTSAGT